MQIYWTLKSIPELSALPRGERGRAWRRVSIKTYRHWQTWVGLLACGGCAVFGAHFGAELGFRMIGGLVGVAIGGFIFGQLAVGVARRYLRAVPHA